MIQALGMIPVPAPGTPVAIDTALPNPDKSMSIHGALFEQIPGQTGKIYIGRKSMDKSSLVGVYAILAIPTTNFLPTFSVALTIAPNGLSTIEFWVDADVAGEGVLVTILQT